MILVQFILEERILKAFRIKKWQGKYLLITKSQISFFYYSAEEVNTPVQFQIKWEENAACIKNQLNT